MPYPAKRIRAAIEQAFLELPEPIRQDIGFHMTDWLDDLEALHQTFSAPESLSPAELQELLINFLVHVPNHVAAAAKLAADYPVSDVFEVGAVALPGDSD